VTFAEEIGSAADEGIVMPESAGASIILKVAP
jgi:hypothetical protein